MSSRLPTKCSTCSQPLDTPLFCGDCRTLHDPEGATLFELLGLPAQFDLDEAEVRRRYFELARDVHPDRLSAASNEQRGLGMRVSARLNRAFEVLSDPIQRAEYLLEISGGRSAVDDKRVPQDVLNRTLMLREEIDEAKAANDQAALDQLGRRIQHLYDTCAATIRELARALPGEPQDRDALREALNSIKYYERMLEQL